ncbi:MAG: hypothetical protein R3D27_11180 [Hyphomicrobiaceae bacterium]
MTMIIDEPRGRRRLGAGPMQGRALGRASHAWLIAAGLITLLAAAAQAAFAQQSSGVPGISIRGTITESPQSPPAAPPPGLPTPGAAAPPAKVPPPFAGTIVVTPPAAPPVAKGAPVGTGSGRVQLSVQLTRDGNRIATGVVWRIYAIQRGARPALVATERVPEPTVTLPAGSYLVVASLGRAYITQRMEVGAGAVEKATLVLNAGGLRVTATIAGTGTAARDSLAYDILSEERDATGERIRIVGGLKPGRIVRLNAGIYQLVSRLGDANAMVKSEVTVEAGKLSEVQVTHQAARVTFKLAERPGGEAIADTQWVILAGSGGIVKETAGALPSHMLAPGTYTVSATSAGRMYQREFAINSGDNLLVEVLAQ